jgi:large subunit ribosomal protein L25
MMERVELRTNSRTLQGKKVKQLRAEGWIPAVVFGPDMASRSIQIEQRDLYSVLRTAGSTALINLFVDNEPEPNVVLAREIQRNALTGRLLHVDFYEVRLTEKVKTMPRLEIVGEAPLVKLGTAVMIHGMTEIEVECLPTDLISSIPVDVSGLETLEDSIVVGDLAVPPAVTILADPGDTVVSLVPARAALADEDEFEEGEEVEGDEEVEAGEEAEAED